MLAEENYREIKLVFDKIVTYPCVNTNQIQCKKNISRSMLCCSSWQPSILPESISETFSNHKFWYSHVVGAVCSVIAQLSLTRNGMMNKLTIKLAAREAQGMGISHPFREAQKKKPDEGIPSQVISGSFHDASWISGEKRVKKEAPCI